MPLPFSYFVKTTTIISSASDANDGKDPLGAGLTDGIFTFSTLNVDRNSTGSAFTNAQAGDYIYLTFGSGTSVDGLYEIDSVTDADNIVLVADAGLIDNSTTVTSSDGPWLTIQHAFDTMATTGQQCVLCDDGGATGADWEPSVTIDNDTNTGGNKGLTMRGGDSRGKVDGTVATISGASLGATDDLLAIETGVDDWIYMDLRFTGATRYNVYNSATGCDRHTFVRCRIDNAADDNVNLQSNWWKWIDTQIDHAGGSGVYNTGYNRGSYQHYVRCRVHHNNDHGISGGFSDLTLVNSMFYSNGQDTAGDGVSFYRTFFGLLVDGCLFYNNVGDGIGVTSSGGATGICYTISNSIFRSNAAYGVSFGSYTQRLTEVVNCCFSNNTSGTIEGLDSDDRNGDVAYMGLFWSDTNVYSDPQFTSEVDGSEDFRLATGSPLRAAGIEVESA